MAKTEIDRQRSTGRFNETILLKLKDLDEGLQDLRRACVPPTEAALYGAAL